jgi:hypothetical protein
MPIQYNILIKPKFDNNIPSQYKKECIRATEGFLGEHHINHFGRMFDGLDKDCDTYYEAEFDFFNRYKKGTLDDALKLLNTKKLFLSGDEYVELEQTINFSKKLKNFFETRDPTVFFYNSWGQYRNNTVPEPFKINTPLGAQDSHVHILPSLSVIRFYRTHNETRWYDYDLLRNFTSDASFTLSDLVEERQKATNPIKKYYILPKQIRQVKKIEEYNNKLWKLESIERIDIPNDYQLPEVE